MPDLPEDPAAPSLPETRADEGAGDVVDSGAPDALGVVEEQELVSDEDSTIPAPGEALDGLLPALAETGHQGVDDALAKLDELAGTTVHDHVEVFDAVHAELRRTLDQAAEQ